MSTTSERPLPLLRVPGPGFIPLLRSLPGLRENPLCFIQEAADRYGDIVQIRLGRLNAFLLNSPSSIQYILVDNNRNYNKDTVQYNSLAKVTGKGLLTNDGEFWLRQRRRIQPAFHPQRINGFGPLMVETTANILQGWEAYAKSGQYLDVDKEMMRLALEILGKALLGIDLTDNFGRLCTVSTRR